MQEISRIYHCGACKGKHANLTTVRECYKDHSGAGPGDIWQSPVIPHNKVGEYIVQQERSGWAADHAEIPSGNYYVLVRTPAAKLAKFANPVENEKYLHIRVGSFTGKWAGHYTVSVYDEGKMKLVPVTDPAAQDEIVGKIKEGNWRLFLTSYGRAFAECPICEQPLETEEIQFGVHKGTDRECYAKIFE